MGKFIIFLTIKSIIHYPVYDGGIARYERIFKYVDVSTAEFDSEGACIKAGERWKKQEIVNEHRDYMCNPK